MDGLSKFKEFVHLHRNQLSSSGVPEHLWRTLSRKLRHQTFDAGNAFQLLMIEYDDDEKDREDPLYAVVVSKPGGIKASSTQDIYLIDHAWTYRLHNARNQLKQVPALLNRLAKMMGASHLDTEQSIEYVMEAMWRYNQMYAIGTTNNIEIPIEDRMPIWYIIYLIYSGIFTICIKYSIITSFFCFRYIMDEFGSAVNHSDSPNFQIVPFVDASDSITYSLLFPIKDAPEGEQVTRDFAEGNDSEIRNALLLPWRHTNFKDVNFKQTEPDSNYFLDGHIEETLPIANAANPKIDQSRPLRVFTTYSMVQQYLNDPLFQVVENEEDADILWLTTHFKAYKEFSEHAPNRFINQFPFENVITIKDLLAIVCRRVANKVCDDSTLVTFPKWLPTTYNLKTELPKFVSFYQARDEKELDNHWIIKPWNLARGLDTYICKNISEIVRLQPTGPKIAQKYIDRPVLFERDDIGAKVKFDVRYVFLVKSTEPLEAYIYTNFFLRFANKPFGLNQFDEYEKHFTVMNYGENLQLLHSPCAEFLKLWDQQYPKHNWTKIENDIRQMLHEVLLGATQIESPCGIGKSPQSRALYAADIMLEWYNDDMQPKLLEINFLPDCKRACEYYPEFFNDIFKLLFFEIPNEKMFRNLKL